MTRSRKRKLRRIAYEGTAQDEFINCHGTGVPATCAGGTLTDPIQFTDNHDKYTKLSQELRITSPLDYRLRGVAGLFYQRQTDVIRAAYEAPDLPAYYSVDGQAQTIYLTQQTRVDRDYAAFGEATFDVTDQFKVSAGIREFWVENTLYGFFGFNDILSGTGEQLCNPPVSAATIIPNYLPCVNTNGKAIDHGETHKINLTYQIDPDRMVYGTYSTGYRPGGVNRIPTIAPYNPDTLTNFEIGWKTAWFDHRLRANGAVFYERWKDVQLAVSGISGITTIVNATNADVKGIEGDVSWLAIDDLTLSASGTYVNARTTQEFCPLDPATEVVTHNCADPTAPVGTQLPVTPKLKINGTARYKFAVGEYQSFLQGTVIHQGASTSQLDQILNSEMGDLPKFTTFDFSAGTGMHNWLLQAYIENAFDKRGDLGRIAQCADANCYTEYRVYPIKPMNFGVKFGQKF